MAEMLPLSQAKTVTKNLLDYLGTTFALADPDTRRVLDAFLQDPATGIFRGPYVRVRLPFRPAADGWREHRIELGGAGEPAHHRQRRAALGGNPLQRFQGFRRLDAGDHRHRFR